MPTTNKTNTSGPVAPKRRRRKSRGETASGAGPVAREVITVNRPDPFLFDAATAARIHPGAWERLQLTLVGCGGTGGWLAPSVARIARLLDEWKEARGIRHVGVTFVDADRIEERNCFRQNFAFAEVGLHKASALARRYSAAWGVGVTARTTKLTGAAELAEIARACRPVGETFDGGTILHVILACADNAACRRAIHDHLKQPDAETWWIDCGNYFAGGQVLVGSTIDPRSLTTEDVFPVAGYARHIPAPSLVRPNLIEEDAGTENADDADDPEARLSCAELTLLGRQGLAVNQRVAAEATDFLARLVVTRDLRRFGAFFDSETNASTSYFATPHRVAETLALYRKHQLERGRVGAPPAAV